MTTVIVGAVVFGLVCIAGRSVYNDMKQGSCVSCGCGFLLYRIGSSRKRRWMVKRI